MKSVVIRGPGDRFQQLASVSGLNVDHAQAADVAGEHILTAYATDDAIAVVRALGLTVDVQETEDDQRARLAQLVQEGGTDVTEIDIA
ncbi:MAG TPA: hypothetical protein VE664_02990 [Actinomycetes bacterium]|nr:hypothetical protein [Actinomycetes bacterium]